MSKFFSAANKSLAKFLPTQTLVLRTREGESEVTFSPLARLGLFLGTVLAIGWMIVATTATISSSFESDNAEARSVAMQDAYEQRLAELVAERDAFALETQQMQERFNLALEQVSAQQDELIDAMTVQNEQRITLFALQRKLNSAIAERNAAQANLDGLQAEFAALTDNDEPRESNHTELVSTLTALNLALSETAELRDNAITETERLETEIAQTQQRIRLDAQRRNRMINQLEDAVTASLGPLEKMLESSGLDVDSLLANIRRNYAGSGGLGGTALSNPNLEGMDEADLRLIDLLEMLDNVQVYNIAAAKIPFSLPVYSSVRYTSPFGMRGGRPHNGIDMAGAVGTPIYATADGVVTFAGTQSGYGNLIVIQHEFGIKTKYAHLSKIHVTKGERVSRGALIGDMGNTGRSSGSHLHYEIHSGGAPVNPMTYIKAGRNVY